MIAANNGNFNYYPIDVLFEGKITLKVNVDYNDGQFLFLTEDGSYTQKDGTVKSCDGFTEAWDKFDVSILSDEYANPMGFTGAFVGIYAADFDDRKFKARFKNFVYKGLK